MKKIQVGKLQTVPSNGKFKVVERKKKLRDTEVSFVIVVPSLHQKRRLEKAFEYLHDLPCIDLDIDDGGTICQLVHQYRSPNKIIVDKRAYERSRKQFEKKSGRK